MKTKVLLLLASFLLLMSCEYSKSVNKDLITGLTTKGNGISCENVYLSDGEDKINRTEFTYGETFYLNFADIKGFKKESQSVFPGMELVVLNAKNDTVLFEKDMFKSSEGFNFSPLLLNANVTAQLPTGSNEEYTLLANIWDKKGKGTFKAKMKFNVVSNKKLKIENTNLNYKEIYLFSSIDKKIVTDNKVKLNEHIFLLIEGIEGFEVVDGKSFIGMKVKATDNAGDTFLDTEDLFEDIGYDPGQINEMLHADIIFNKVVSNPVTCEVFVWDKKGENKIRVTTDLIVK